MKTLILLLTLKNSDIGAIEAKMEYQWSIQKTLINQSNFYGANIPGEASLYFKNGNGVVGAVPPCRFLCFWSVQSC